MWYDVVVLAILIVAMVRGAVRGVIWQLAGIAGIVLCLVFAETISAIGSPYVPLEPPLNQWVVMFVGYLLLSFLSFGVARVLDGAIEKAQLKEYNKHLGAVFGLVKGVVFCLVITFFLVTLSEKTRDMLKTSRSARYAALILDRMHPVMPDQLRGALETYLRELDADDLDLKYADKDGANAVDASDPSADPSTWDPVSGSSESPPPGWELAGTDPIDELLKQVPGLTNDYVRDGARQVYEAIPQQSREQFIQELRDAGPSFVFSVLQRWQAHPPTEETGSADELLKQIPGLTNDYVRDGARQVYEAIPQQSREQFIQELRDAGPSFVFSVLQRWQAKPPTEETGSTQNVGYVQPAPQTMESLTAAIAGQLARSVQDQTAYEQSIAAGLAGLPDAVSLGVLKDWQADLSGSTTDPDPQTNTGTSLDQRIIRQLTIQRVSVYQLSQELRDRLMQARRQ